MKTEEGKVVVITGANSGLGFATAQRLASLSPQHTVVLACRDAQRGAAARRAIESATGSRRIRDMLIDTSSMPSVRAFAAAIETELDGPIDALVCNAGIARAKTPTTDGIDTVFATNHLGHFLLTLSLLPTMSSNARIVSVSSDMHSPPGPRLRWPGAEAVAHGRSPRLRYSYSKLCNLFFTYELTRRLRASGSAVVAAAFNPGLMTETSFATMPTAVGAVMKRIFASRVGALDSSAAALTALAAQRNPTAIDGGYFDRTAAAPVQSSALSYDLDDARELWQLSARLTGADL